MCQMKFCSSGRPRLQWVGAWLTNCFFQFLQTGSFLKKKQEKKEKRLERAIFRHSQPSVRPYKWLELFFQTIISSLPLLPPWSLPLPVSRSSWTWLCPRRARTLTCLTTLRCSWPTHCWARRRSVGRSWAERNPPETHDSPATSHIRPSFIFLLLSKDVNLPFLPKNLSGFVLVVLLWWSAADTWFGGCGLCRPKMELYNYAVQVMVDLYLL